MKIVADKNIPFLRGVAEAYGDVIYLSGADFTKDVIKDADTLIVRTVTHFGKDILEGSNVKLICSATIGYDHIDTQYCDQNGITWKNAPGCNSGSVQQYIVSALITLFQKKDIPLKGKTIGVVGVGNVGSKVAKACELLGMKVLLNDPPRQELEGATGFVDLKTIKREADIITFHTPLVKEGLYKTYQLADDTFFKELKKKPVIINSARGGIIETNAIKQALSNNYISGTVIDCWENEPNIDREYMRMVDIATPHIAGYSADGKANATKMSLNTLADFWNLDKDPINSIVVPDVVDNIIDYNSISNDQINNIILKTYDLLRDHDFLVNQPASFSNLRSNYPLRREYCAYNIQNIPDDVDVSLLKQLGFSML